MNLYSLKETIRKGGKDCRFYIRYIKKTVFSIKFRKVECISFIEHLYLDNFFIEDTNDSVPSGDIQCIFAVKELLPRRILYEKNSI